MPSCSMLFHHVNAVLVNHGSASLATFFLMLKLPRKSTPITSARVLGVGSTLIASTMFLVPLIWLRSFSSSGLVFLGLVGAGRGEGVRLSGLMQGMLDSSMVAVLRRVRAWSEGTESSSGACSWRRFTSSKRLFLMRSYSSSSLAALVQRCEFCREWASELLLVRLKSISASLSVRWWGCGCFCTVENSSSRLLLALTFSFMRRGTHSSSPIISFMRRIVFRQSSSSSLCSSFTRSCDISSVS